MQLRLELLPMPFAVCQLAQDAPMPPGAPFTFWARTDDEVSLVCPEADAPGAYLRKEDGWRALRVAGTLDFSLVGILSRLTAALAEAGVGVFVISTYLTDYVLVREGQLEAAVAALSAHGHAVTPLS